MFSKTWDFSQLKQQCTQHLSELKQQGLLQHIQMDASNELLSSPNWDTCTNLLVICSGYPEHAGVWSYTLLEQSQQDPGLFKSTSMSSYFETASQTDMGLIALNPHQSGPSETAEDSIIRYIQQLKYVYERWNHSSPKKSKLHLYGYSLGGKVIIDFLNQNPDYISQTTSLILVDPAPPNVGRRRMDENLGKLVDQAQFYGLKTKEGLPGEFAEASKMRLKLKPHLLTCPSHGHMPNQTLPLILEALDITP